MCWFESSPGHFFGPTIAVLLLMRIFGLLLALIGFGTMASCQNTPTKMSNTPFAVERTDAEWRSILTPEQFKILRQKGTEYPGTGKYDKHFEPGTYTCAAPGPSSTPQRKQQQAAVSNSTDAHLVVHCYSVNETQLRPCGHITSYTDRTAASTRKRVRR